MITPQNFRFWLQLSSNRRVLARAHSAEKVDRASFAQRSLIFSRPRKKGSFAFIVGGTSLDYVFARCTVSLHAARSYFPSCVIHPILHRKPKASLRRRAREICCKT